MKAYAVRLESDPDKGNEIIFAKNTKSARSMAHATDLAGDADSFLDIRVKRAPEFDGMQNASQKEVMRVMWREGWWFHQSGAPFEDEPEEQFNKWYERTFKNE